MSGTTSTSVPSEAASAPGVGGFTHKQVLVILTGLMLGMFLAALDQNIVATAIRTIGDDLHGLSVQAWVTTAYLITSTVSTPLYGKLSDLYGRKPFFLIAITIFITGSAACAFATSMYMLAAFRAYQGLGAGGLFSLALAIIGDIVSPRDRAKYQGYFLAVFGTASVLGPVLGGFFAGASSILTITGWRWVFLVNVPIGVVALYVVWRTLNLPNTHRPARIDWVGVASLFVCLVPLLVVAEQGQKVGLGFRDVAGLLRAGHRRARAVHSRRASHGRRRADSGCGSSRTGVFSLTLDRRGARRHGLFGASPCCRSTCRSCGVSRRPRLACC